MTTLSVTARGQVTFRKEVLQHLGIKPGDRIEIDLLPDGRAELKAAAQKGSIRELAGLLKGKTNGKVALAGAVTQSVAKTQEALAALRGVDWAVLTEQRSALIERFNREIRV